MSCADAVYAPFYTELRLVLSVKVCGLVWANGLSEMDTVPFSTEVFSAERHDRKSRLLLSGWRIEVGLGDDRWQWPLPVSQCASRI